MKHLKRNATKIGLLTAALLVFSACGSDEASKPSLSVPSAPLFDQQPIAAGDVCEFGGTLVRGGLDQDKDGKLSDSEVSSETPICNDEDAQEGGPALLVKTETLEIGDETCPNGGQRVHVGYDLDEDGALSAEEIADEQTKTTEICNNAPLDVCAGAEQLQIVSIALEEDPFGYHEVDRTYGVRVELNQPIDIDSLELKDILKTLGEGALAYTVDPDNDKVAILEFQGDMNMSYAMAIAANDGCTTGSAGLRTPPLHVQQPRLNVTYSAQGFSDEGETIELCYETRNADSCSTSIRYIMDTDAPTSDCIELSATAVDMQNQSVSVRIICQDSENPGLPSAQHDRMIPTSPAVISFNSAEFPGLAAGGEVELHWETFKMESCELSDGTNSDDVPLNESSHILSITETTEFVLTCLDIDGEEHSASRRVTVGPGILSFNSRISQRSPGFPLTFSANWETSMLYGNCDVQFEYASTNLLNSNIDQQMNHQLNGRYRHGSTQASQTNPAEDLDAQIQGTATLTCRSSFPSEPAHTLVIPLQQN